MAGWTTQRDYTMLRALVMDFPEDRTARELNDEYMFGSALLVAPITQYQQRSRSVYLPSSAQWYDYWSGRPAASGSITAAAPYDQIPIFVRAGSIIPYQPDMQYIGEKPADPITLYVYAGANGRFALYEDQGTTFDYEKGAFAEIPIQWDDHSRTLTIGERSGVFPGMLPHVSGGSGFEGAFRGFSVRCDRCQERGLQGRGGSDRAEIGRPLRSRRGGDGPTESSMEPTHLLNWISSLVRQFRVYSGRFLASGSSWNRVRISVKVSLGEWSDSAKAAHSM
jgi:hypothetical protein